MENQYGITVANKYSLFLNEDEDPLEILKIQEVNKTTKKADKSKKNTAARNENDAKPASAKQNAAASWEEIGQNRPIFIACTKWWLDHFHFPQLALKCKFAFSECVSCFAALGWPWPLFCISASNAIATLLCRVTWYGLGFSMPWRVTGASPSHPEIRRHACPWCKVKGWQQCTLYTPSIIA